MTCAQGGETAKTEKTLETSPEHILGEDKSTLFHESGQLVGLGLGKRMRINAGIENDKAMTESLWEIASDKKRNAHLFQGVDEGERILWIGAGVGPEYRDLKRERFWKLLEGVSVLVNDFVQWNFFGSQGRRVLGTKFPNRAARAQSGDKKGDCQRRFQSDILNPRVYDKLQTDFHNAGIVRYASSINY
jgi:hypothetical protein